MRILIVEDEPTLGRQLKSTLEGVGYAVDLATDGEEGHYLGSNEAYDVVVLDLGLPEVDGLTVLDRWRKERRNFPVLVLTARDSWSDKVAGLDAGADDYLAKPFNSRELLARLRSIIRRTRELNDVAGDAVNVNFRFNGWLLRVGARDLSDPAGKPITLTTSEFDLLHAMVLHPQRVLSREFLIDRTRGGTADTIDRVIDVQVGRLRRKLGDDPREPMLIRTVRGDGYLFSPPVIRC